VEQVKQIIDAAHEPYKTVFWLVAETGIRRGKICGLNVGDVNLNEQAITVQRSRWKSKLKQRASSEGTAKGTARASFRKNRPPEALAEL
jgi:integrase